MPLAGASKSPALLVVHGIGTQKRGDTLCQCVEGLLRFCGGASLDGGLTLDDITKNGLDAVVVRQGSGLAIRVYEVYWADLFPDAAVANYFDKFDFIEITWFPLFNYRAGMLDPAQYSKKLVYARTFQLLLLQVIASVAWETLAAARETRTTTLDQTASDVWLYMHSLSGELMAGSPLHGASERILQRFDAAWQRAKDEDPQGDSPCDVIAHSLGSVVAFHGLARQKDAPRRFLTIGSPLEKTRFIWAKYFQPSPWSAGEWVNFHSPSDPVSGRLKRFDYGERRIVNKRLWGVGGFGEAHLGYFRDPRVMHTLAAGLGATPCAKPPRYGPPWWKRRAIDLGVPVAMLIVTGIGAAAFWGLFWLMLFLFGLPFGPGVRAYIFSIGWYVLPALWLAAVINGGYRVAERRHAEFWSLKV